MKLNKTSHTKRLVAFLLAFCFVLFTGLQEVRAGELEDLQIKSERLAKQIAESEAKIKRAANDKNKQERLLTELNKQLAALEEQISVIESSLSLLSKDVNSLAAAVSRQQNEISKLDKKIQDTQNDIKEKQDSTENTRQRALERVRAGYVAGNPSKLEVLLSAKDMAGLFYNAELLKQMAKKDEELIDRLKEETKNLKSLQSDLEKDKEELEKTKKELDAKLSDLKAKKSGQESQARALKDAKGMADSKQEHAKDTIARLDKNSTAYKNELARLQRERAEADKKIDALILQQGSSSSSPKNEANEGDFVFPFPYPSCFFSALFGRYPSGGAHYGLDICVTGGTHGKTIIAVQGGKVLAAAWNNSYGYYVNIDHGAGVFTLYAHCSQLVVSAGQTVKKGQKIAEAGSTGNSTGPHLHFEVRLNSNNTVSRVNPLPYFPGKPNRVNVAFSGL